MASTLLICGLVIKLMFSIALTHHTPLWWAPPVVVLASGAVLLAVGVVALGYAALVVAAIAAWFVRRAHDVELETDAQA